MKKHLIVLLAAIMLSSLCACTRSESAGAEEVQNEDLAAEETVSQDAEENDIFTEEEEGTVSGDITAVDGDTWQEAFRKVLENNETYIKSYSIQFDGDNNYINNGESTDEGADNAMADDCVAIEDLNGDDVPELMYIAPTSQYREGFFRIWYYDEQKKSAVLCDYKGQTDHENNYAAKEGPFMDRPYAAGTRYVIYTGQDKGIIHIVSIISDTSAFNESYTYKMDESGNMELLTNAVNIYSLDQSDPPRDDYYVDGREVSGDIGGAAFKEAGSDFGELIMFSGNDPNLSAFSHIKTTGSHAISFDEAIDQL